MSKNNFNKIIGILKPGVIRNKRVINGSYFIRVSQDVGSSPFVDNFYDFDNLKGFYKGLFNYIDPVVNQNEIGTVERYGRRRIIKKLLNMDLDNKIIVDIGAGCLNIMREISKFKDLSKIMLINLDISGPWSSKNSMLVTGELRNNNQKCNHVNIEYDFNKSLLPIKKGAVDIIVSCMALHHIKPYRRRLIFQNIYNTLKHKGLFINTDFYIPNETGKYFTAAGAKGPKECTGYGMYFREYIKLIKQVGFSFMCNKINVENKNNYFTNGDIETSLNNYDMVLPINKATFYSIFNKLTKK